MSDYGRERVVFLEVDQPLCSLAYGEGACPAVLGTDSDRKCFNTRATCPVPDSYLPESGSPLAPHLLTLRFSLGQLDTLQYGSLIPSMIDEPEVTPGRINLGGMDRNLSALGSREVVTVKFADHLHSDLLVDPYRLERISGAAMADSNEAYDPATRGTFWGKWLARNPYHQHYACRVREGYLGDDLDDMRVRHYVIDRIDGPDDDGTVTLVAKDLFSLIEAKKAKAPPASRGELSANLSAVGSSFSVSPSGIGELDYPHYAGSPGELVVAIGDELILCSRSADTFTVLERGYRNTVAADHDEEDLVQWVLEYRAELAHDIVYALLRDYTAVDVDAAIDKPQWDIEAAALTQVYSALITKPTPVVELIGELAEQAGFTVWPDVSTGMINFAPLRAQAPTTVVTDNDWIADGTLSLKRQASRRASQVWVYYGQINPVEDLDERRNYHSRVVVAPAENLYVTESVVEIFSRWIQQFGRQAAEAIGQRRLAMFADAPLEAAFEGHASRAEEVALARYLTLRVAEVQDATGAEADVTMAATSIESTEGRVMVTAQQVRFYTEPGDTGERVIYIENDVLNLNLRTVHDALFAVPVGGSPGEVVRFIVLAGVFVGSSSAATPAMVSGTWPSGVNLYLDNSGRIQGHGGAGGKGTTLLETSTVGAPGGDAIETTAALIIDNDSGEIWAGGGGGGGTNGIGGSGGAGTNPGAGGSGFVLGLAGTAEVGGAGVPDPDGSATTGGAGGGPGLSGGAGVGASAKAGGSPGDYIVGNALVTWVNNGDRRGGVTA